MPSALTLVPPKGPVALFANNANRSQPFALLDVEGSPRVVEVVTSLSEQARYIGLRQWMQDRDMPVFSINAGDFETHRRKYEFELRRADVVIIPMPSQNNTPETRMYENCLSAAKPTAVFINPISMQNLAGTFNYTHKFTTGQMDQKDGAVRQCVSQIARVDFEMIQHNAARGLGFELHHGRLDPNLPFAERFQLRYMMPDGKWALPSRSLNEASGLLQNGKVLGNIFYASPHADDLVIAAGAFVADLVARGYSCLDLVFASGQGGVTADFIRNNRDLILGSLAAGSAIRQLLMNNYSALDGLPPDSAESKAAEKFIKTFVRMSELAETDRILGAEPQLLNLPFYDNRNPDGSRIISAYEYDLARTALAERFDRIDMAFLPLKGDMHPDHVATRIIAHKILADLAKAQAGPIPVFSYASPWFTGAPAINALLYYHASKTFSQDHPAVKYFERAMAVAGTELSCGFAAAPPALSAYCEGDVRTIIAEGFNISTLLSLRQQ